MTTRSGLNSSRENALSRLYLDCTVKVIQLLVILTCASECHTPMNSAKNVTNSVWPSLPHIQVSDIKKKKKLLIFKVSSLIIKYIKEEKFHKLCTFSKKKTYSEVNDYTTPKMKTTLLGDQRKMHWRSPTETHLFYPVTTDWLMESENRFQDASLSHWSAQ